MEAVCKDGTQQRFEQLEQDETLEEQWDVKVALRRMGFSARATYLAATRRPAGTETVTPRCIAEDISGPIRLR